MSKSRTRPNRTSMNGDGDGVATSPPAPITGDGDLGSMPVTNKLGSQSPVLDSFARHGDGDGDVGFASVTNKLVPGPVSGPSKSSRTGDGDGG